MTEQYRYTISTENVHATIETLLPLFSEHSVKVSKSVLKEVISSLLGFSTSNVLDAEVKKNKDRLKAQDVFDHTGHHKYTQGITRRSRKNPLRLYRYFKKHQGISTFVTFDDDFQASGGFKFSQHDVLFCEDKYSAVKMVLNWDEVAKFEFHYWKDVGIDEDRERDGGYWELHFVGDGDEQFVGHYGENYMDSSDDRYAHINSPDTPQEHLIKFFIDQMSMQAGNLFFANGREEFESCLRDLITEYYLETFSVDSDEAFVKHVEKFLPFMDIEEIVEMEVGNAPLSFLKILKNYDARFDRPKLLDNAVLSGDIEICRYLLQNGNSLENLFTHGQAGSVTSYFHDRIDRIVNPGLVEAAAWANLIHDTKIYFTTTSRLGIPIDRVDSNGCSVLHYAAKGGFSELYQLLISLGSDDTLKNSQGKTPQMIADDASKKMAEQDAQPRHMFDLFLNEIFGSR